MKSILLLLLIQVTFSSLIFSQNASREKHTVYKILIKDIHGINTRGTLVGVSDSTVTINRPASHQVRSEQGTSKQQNDTLRQLVFSYTVIKTIRFRKKHSTLRGALIGFLSGAILGAIIGFSSGDDPEGSLFRTTAGEKAAILGAAGAFAGTTIGVIAGSLSHKKFIINGDVMKFRDMQIATYGY